MNLKSFYAELVQQHTDLEATIRLVRQKLQLENGHSMMSAAEAALQAHQITPRGPYKPRETRFDGKPRKRARQTMRALPVVKVPEGLSTKGMELKPAILEALKVYRKPATAKEVTALMLGSGFEHDYAGPLTTVVATVIPRYAKELGVKKTPKGWTLKK